MRAQRLLEVTATTAAVILVISMIGLFALYLNAAPDELRPRPHSVENMGGRGEDGLLAKTIKDPTAFFTLCLTAVTAILAGVSICQLKYLRNAEMIATETAMAAKESARVASAALVATPRPWIKITDASVTYLEITSPENS